MRKILAITTVQIKVKKLERGHLSSKKVQLRFRRVQSRFRMKVLESILIKQIKQRCLYPTQ